MLRPSRSVPIVATAKGYTWGAPIIVQNRARLRLVFSHLLPPLHPFPFLIFRRLGRMFSLFYVPLFASAVLGANPFQHYNLHRRLAHDFAATDVSTTNSTNATVDMVAAAYFAGWHADNFTLDDVSWEKYTHMIYAFA